MELLDSLFSNLVPLCGIMMPVMIVLLVLIFSHRKQKERNKLISQMIERGEDPAQVLPLLDTSKKEVEKSPTKHFKTGVTLISIGLGLVIVDLLSSWGTLGIGAFIGIIGLGEIVVAWYLRKYSK